MWWEERLSEEARESIVERAMTDPVFRALLKRDPAKAKSAVAKLVFGETLQRYRPRVSTVGQVAERAGVAVSALHFYERQGLIHSRRTTGNQRRYRRDTLRRVSFIRISQRVGIPLARIRQALDQLPENRTPTRADWAAVSAQWRDELDARITQLIRLRDDLTGCIGCGCLSLETCAIQNPGDEIFATYGPGAPVLAPSEGRLAPSEGRK